MAKNVIDGRMPDGRFAVGKALREHRASALVPLVPTTPSGG